MFDWYQNSSAIDVKMNRSILEEKASFSFSCMDRYFHTVSIAKATSKTVGSIIHSIKFLFPEVALYFYKSIILLCLEYCCQVWVGVPEHVTQTTKTTNGPSRNTSLGPWLIVEI